MDQPDPTTLADSVAAVCHWLSTPWQAVCGMDVRDFADASAAADRLQRRVADSFKTRGR